VATALVAQHQVDIAQGDGGLAADFIGPHDGAMTDHEFGLGEYPVEQAFIGVGPPGEVQPGHIQLAIGSPAHIQGRAVHIQLVELQPQHRPGRQREQHPRQPQRVAPFGVEQTHIEQLEGRQQTGGIRGDALDADVHPQCTRGCSFQLRAQLADSRHNEQMQSAPHRREHEPCEQQQPQGPTGHEGAGPQ
jgi:hypothetical protein